MSEETKSEEVVLDRSDMERVWRMAEGRYAQTGGDMTTILQWAILAYAQAKLWLAKGGTTPEGYTTHGTIAPDGEKIKVTVSRAE